MAKKKPKMPTKIAILGTSPSSNDIAPYDDNEWMIWNLGRNYQMGKRFDLWFELHEIEYVKELGIIQEQLDFYKKCGNRLILREPHKDYPEALVYPKDEMLAQFKRKYFTSSIAWMMGMAIAAKPTHIGLWGVDLCVNEEYNYQKGCVEYFIGMAEGMGIEVILPRISPLCRASYLYGFDEPNWLADINLRRRETDIKFKQHEEEARKQALAVEYLRGVNDCLKDQEKRFM